jgi:peroxiredoxin
MQYRMFQQFRLIALAAGLAMFLSSSPWPKQALAEYLKGRDAGQVETLRTLDGSPVQAENLDGKIAVLAVSTSFLLTREQAASVKRLATDYAARGIVVYWVLTDSAVAKSKNFASDEDLREFARKNGLTAKVLRDPDGAAMQRYHVTQVPAFVILNHGRIAGAPVEGIDTDGDVTAQVRQRLDQLQ